MWPFKKKEVQSFSDYLLGKGWPPCGDKKTHYSWVKSWVKNESETPACPKCAINIARRKELADMETLADLTARKVVELLKGVEI